MDTPSQTQYTGYYNPYFAMLQQMQGTPMYVPQQAYNQNQQPKQESKQVQGELIWVEGIADVDAKQLSPGSVAVFFDKNIDGRYYIRIRNDIGQYQNKIFDSTEVIEGDTTKVDMSKYVTREELTELINKLGGTSNGKQSVQSATANHTIINAPAESSTSGSNKA